MLFCPVTGDVLENVALNKQSYQVSEYSDQFAAGLANDGIVDSCARSQRETNPWWSVDLGVETLVAQVNLTNAGDDTGTDLHCMRLVIYKCCLYYMNLRPLYNITLYTFALTSISSLVYYNHRQSGFITSDCMTSTTTNIPSVHSCGYFGNVNEDNGVCNIHWLQMYCSLSSS